MISIEIGPAASRIHNPPALTAMSASTTTLI